MKKIFTTILLLVLFNTNYGHKQWVHQHIVNQAYLLFEQSDLPGEITTLFESLFKDTNGNLYPIGEPNHPSVSFVTGGAWNEDDYDIVFGYSEQYPGIPIASVSHFWNPDNSDRYAKNNLEFVTGSTENAFKKAEYLWNGTGKFYMPGPFQFAEGTEEQLALEELGLSYTTSYSNLIIGYDSLPLMYKENKYYIWGVRLVSGTTLMFENPLEINNSPYYYPIFFSANILGRIAHLLADMSVPAHVKIKSHPCNVGWGERFEMEIGGKYWSSIWTSCDEISLSGIYPAQNYTYVNASNQGGILLPQFKQDPLYYLFYTSAQITDVYSSQIYNGDYLSGDRSYDTANPDFNEMRTIINNIASSFNTWLDEFHSLADNGLVYSIRATAGLYYLFCIEADIIPETCYLTFTNNFSGISETFNITVNSATEPAPTEPYEVIEGHTIQVEADQNRVYNNVFYKFSHWTDGNTNASRTITASQTETITAYYDAINPPTTPQGLTVSESTDEHPVLQWTASTGSDIIYDIYRQENYNGWGKIDYSTTTEYKDIGVTTTYRHGDDIYYKVMAVTSNKDYELYSDYSNTVEIEARLEKQMIDEEIVEEAPKVYALNSNYPNPFNPTTQISYQIPNNGFVNLTVYNSLGQEIAVLVNQQQSIGRYTVQFNASNLPSGIYFYKLQAGEFSKVNKMLLVR